MGHYPKNTELSNHDLVECMNFEEKIAANRSRMSRAPKPDREDSEIMNRLVYTRAKCKTRKEWISARKRLKETYDLVVVHNPSKLRWAK
jgi:hypothetical protein